MTYYDDFEMACGCRMHCVCPKTGTCGSCGAYGTIEHIGSHQWRCAGGCNKASGLKRLREENARLEAELAWRRQRDAPTVYPA